MACAAALYPPPPASPPPGIDAWAACFSYEGVGRELVARMKYRGTHAATHWLVDRLVAALIPVVPPADDRAGGWMLASVTWAPTTASRRRTRGFDHAELIARAVARHIGVTCRPLLRRGSGPPQTGRTRVDRQAGPSFSARGIVHGPVLVVDDVATTGATLQAAARALRAAGATSVTALTVARTP